MRKHVAKQHAFAAVEPSGWILRWTVQPAAKMVRTEVGKSYADDHESFQDGWRRAAKEYGLRVQKIWLRPV